MAFVFKEGRKIVQERTQEDNLSKMTQNELFTLEKTLTKQLYKPVTQNIQTKIFKKKYLPKFQEFQESIAQQLRQWNRKPQGSGMCRGSLLNHPQIRKYNTQNKNSKEIYVQKIDQLLGPGSYNIASHLQSKSLVKYGKFIKINNSCKTCYQPGSFENNLIVKQNIKGNVAYQENTLQYQNNIKSTIFECLPNQQQKEKGLKIEYKCMKSSQFRSSVNNSIHHQQFPNTIPKHSIQNTKRSKLHQEKNIDQGIIYNVEKKPGRYQIVKIKRKTQNRKNIFVSESLRIPLEQKKYHLLSMESNFSYLGLQNDQKNNILKQKKLNLDPKPQPAFFFSSERFDQKQISNRKIQHENSNTLLKKVNKNSKAFFGSPRHRFQQKIADQIPSFCASDNIVKSNISPNLKKKQNPNPFQYNLPQLFQKSIPTKNPSSLTKDKKVQKNIYKQKENSNKDDMVVNTPKVGGNLEKRQKKCQQRKSVNQLKKYNPFKMLKSNSQEYNFHRKQLSWNKKSFNKNFTKGYMKYNNPIQQLTLNRIYT